MTSCRVDAARLRHASLARIWPHSRHLAFCVCKRLSIKLCERFRDMLTQKPELFESFDVISLFVVFKRFETKAEEFHVDAGFKKTPKDPHPTRGESVPCQSDDFDERDTSQHAEIENGTLVRFWFS